MTTMHNVRIPQLTEEQRAKFIERFPGVSRSPHAIPASYRAIYAKARELRLPEMYRDDLEVWDRGHLTKDKPAVFGWSPYSCGTDIFYPEVDGIEHVQACERIYNSHAERVYFFWNGTALEQVTPQGLIERLAQHLDVAKYERQLEEANRAVGVAVYKYQQSLARDLEYGAVQTARAKRSKAEEALAKAKEYHARYAPADDLRDEPAAPDWANMAIYADADAFHFTCARAVYGDAAIDRVLRGDGAPQAYDHGASTAPDWPKDHEGNFITAAEAQADDSCGRCLRRVSDEPGW